VFDVVFLQRNKESEINTKLKGVKIQRPSERKNTMLQDNHLSLETMAE
jgi:hypothetical protein